MNTVSSILQRATKTDKPANVLTFFYNGRFDVELAKTGHRFYGTPEISCYDWPAIKEIKVDNLYSIPTNSIYDINYDLILVNHRTQNQKAIRQICSALQVPTLIVDHDFNIENPYTIFTKRKQSPFTSIGTLDMISKQMGCNYTIPYGIEKLEPKEKDIDVLVTGSFLQADYHILNNIAQKFKNCKIVGKNPGFDKSESVDTYEEYLDLFARSKIYVNLATQFNIPHELLWAYGGDCAIVTTTTAVTQQFLEPNVNCLTEGSFEGINHMVETLLKNDKQREALVANSHSLLEQFDHNKFLQHWTDIINDYRYRPFTHENIS